MKHARAITKIPARADWLNDIGGFTAALDQILALLSTLGSLTQVLPDKDKTGI